MWIVTVLVLLAGGLLGAANLIVAKKPDAKQLIDKLTPYQGIIGIVLLVWGIWDLISLLRFLSLLSAAPFWWIIYLLVTLTELGLGFLLGYGLLSQYIFGKSPEAQVKGELVRAKLAGYQGPLGLTAIALAILFLILTLTR